MSVAKSVLSALVGIAIGEGRIGSVDDPITRYVPELAERDRRFEKITLRHLLTMTSGPRYEEDGGPWGDDTATYYALDLRALARRRPRSPSRPGAGSTTTTSTRCWSGWRWSGPPAAWTRPTWRPAALLLGMEASGS